MAERLVLAKANAITWQVKESVLILMCSVFFLCDFVEKVGFASKPGNILKCMPADSTKSVEKYPSENIIYKHNLFKAFDILSILYRP